MESSTFYWIVPIIMMLLGFFFLSKSFFHGKKEESLELKNEPDGDLIDGVGKAVPVVSRDKREPYLEDANLSGASIDTSGLHDTVNPNHEDMQLNSSLDEADLFASHEHTSTELVDDEQANVDALGDTLSSLEHATADIMPMVDKKGEVANFEGSSTLLDEHLQTQEENDNIDVLNNPSEVISVILLPDANINFDGQAIVEVLDAYGLKFGQMNLYHRYLSEEGKGQLLFSVMRYSEDAQSQPFDIQTLSEETVDGLTFFMPLPHPKAVEAMGCMLSLAGSIARDLNGTLYNESFEALTYHEKDEIKDYVASYKG